MASSSPPPPPDPNRNGNNPFDKSHYTPTSSSKARPSNSLRRAKTLSNPDGETTWRRDPLLDITNSYLAREATPRLQRVPLDFALRATDDLALTPTRSPSRLGAPGGIPLRRTRSEAPALRVAPFDLESSPHPRQLDDLSPLRVPSTPASPAPARDDVDSSTPVRERRPRTRSSTAAAVRQSSSSAATRTPSSSPVPPIAGVRRTRSSSSHTRTSESAHSPATPPSTTASTRRRRTFGGLSTLSEDAAGETSRGSEEPADSGSDRGTRGGSSENEHRRLRRRRTTGGASVSASGLPTGPTSLNLDKQSLTSRRSGLR